MAKRKPADDALDAHAHVSETAGSASGRASCAPEEHTGPDDGVPPWRTPHAGTPGERGLGITLLMIAAGMASLMVGCAGYRIGSATLYPPDIRTVYVPMFESNSFRPDLGERLTEAVIKEIEGKTPYKVVGNHQADSVLSGTLVGETKRVLVETPTDESRELQLNFVVHVRWTDRHADYDLASRVIELDAALVELSRDATLVPEVGQSISTSQQIAIQRLAEQIVSLMEVPW
jgi:hypothetical protein